MTKALVVGLGLVLGVGVVSAQPKRSPRRKPPATAPATSGQPATTPDAPGNTSGDAATPSARPAGTDAKDPAAPDPRPPAIPAAQAGDTPPAARTGTGHTTPPPMKTDEKAGANEALQRSAGYKNVSKADEDCALAAFRQGNDLLNNGLFPHAEARYREALRCWDHPAIHYNLALALINLNQPIEVFDQLNESIKFSAEPIGQDKFDHAKEYLKLVAGQLADIEVSCDKPGAKVAVDGKEVFVAPGNYKAKVRVGKHTFHADKEGYNARITAPFIGPGETFRIELKLYTAEELTRYRRRWDRTWLPYTVIGTGAVLGIVGGILELSAKSNFNDYDNQVRKCNAAGNSTGCDVRTGNLPGILNTGNTERTLGYVGYGIAGAAMATGALLTYLNRRQPYQIRAEELEEHSDPRPIAVAPIVSPDMTGAMVQGHF